MDATITCPDECIYTLIWNNGWDKDPIMFNTPRCIKFKAQGSTMCLTMYGSGLIVQWDNECHDYIE